MGGCCDTPSKTGCPDNGNVTVPTWYCGLKVPKCTLVKHNGHMYLAQEDIIGDPMGEDPATSDKFSKALTLDKAIREVAKCMGCCADDLRQDITVDPVTGVVTATLVDSQGVAQGAPITWYGQQDTDTYSKSIAPELQADGSYLIQQVLWDKISDSQVTPQIVTSAFILPPDKHVTNLACVAGFLVATYNDLNTVITGYSCDHTTDTNTQVAITDNGDGTLTFNDGTTLFSTTDTAVGVQDNGDGTYTFTSPDGSSVTLDGASAVSDTDTRLVPQAPVLQADGTTQICWDVVNIVTGAMVAANAYCSVSQVVPQNESVVIEVAGTGIAVTTTVGGVSQTDTMPIEDMLVAICATPALKDILKACLLANATLTLAKVAQPLGGAPAVGDLINYTITVKSIGDDDVTNLVLTDDNGDVTGGPIASLASGASDATTFTVSHTITQADMDAGMVTNQATVTGQDPNGGQVTALSSNVVDGAPASTVTTLAQSVNMTLTKEATPSWTGSASPGDTIAYEIIVTNTGGVSITGITVIDPLIPTFLPATIDLTPGESSTFNTTYTLVMSDITAGKVDNTAIATGAKPDGSSIVVLSDDPSSAINVDADGDGNPDDVTTVVTEDACSVLNDLATKALEDALNGTVYGYAWTAPVAGVPMVVQEDAFNGTVLHYLLANNNCASASLVLEAEEDALNGGIKGYYVKA